MNEAYNFYSLKDKAILTTNLNYNFYVLKIVYVIDLVYAMLKAKLSKTCIKVYLPFY